MTSAGGLSWPGPKSEWACVGFLSPHTRVKVVERTSIFKHDYIHFHK
jgi:hypothetical protein